MTRSKSATRSGRTLLNSRPVGAVNVRVVAAGGAAGVWPAAGTAISRTANTKPRVTKNSPNEKSHGFEYPWLQSYRGFSRAESHPAQSACNQARVSVGR